MDTQGLKLDINLATPGELTQLPGVGKKMAARIIEARPFFQVEDLKAVSGINQNVLERLRSYITVSNIEYAAPESTEQASIEQIEPLAEEAPAVQQAEKPDEETELESEPTGESTPLDAEESAGTISGVLEAAEADTLASEAELEDAPGTTMQAQASSSASGAEGILKEPESPQKVDEKTHPRLATRSQALWLALGSSLLAFFLAITLSLGFLALINGGLRYASPAQINGLQRQVAGLSSQTDILQNDLDGLRTRMNNLEGLSGRVGDVEQSMENLQQDIEAVIARADRLDQQVNEVSSTVEELQNRSLRFEGFLDGLRGLLDDIFQP